MKGPGIKLDLDVRRVWRCPKCAREFRLAGEVVARRCGCAEEGVSMQLVSEPKRRRPVEKPAIALPIAEGQPVAMTNDETPNDEGMTKLE
jgi:hypothetical protein